MQTGAIEAVKQEKAVPEKGGRNYELDFFRLVFALLVFIYHTNPFIGKNTRVVLPPDLGAGAVHFFFIHRAFVRRQCKSANQLFRYIVVSKAGIDAIPAFYRPV